MARPVSIETLDVIGFADRLEPGTLPAVVPPLFRFRDEPQRILVPPFSLADGHVWRATERCFPEIEILRDQGEITLFEDPFPARADYELWFDNGGARRYEPLLVALGKRRDFARDAFGRARVAFRQNRLDEAERLCTAAIAANDNSVDAFVLKAAIRARWGDAAGKELMIDLASDTLDRGLVDLLVNDFLAQPAEQPVRGRRPPMSGIAMLRAA